MGYPVTVSVVYGLQPARIITQSERVRHLLRSHSEVMLP